MHVTGIGGVFIKAKDPKALASWYQEQLGVPFGDNLYVQFRWINEDPSAPGSTVFSFAKEESNYFDPSTKQCMINFRVKDLDGLLEKLRKTGVWVHEKTEDYGYGKFSWCMDIEGNKIELWEPVDDKL